MGKSLLNEKIEHKSRFVVHPGASVLEAIIYEFAEKHRINHCDLMDIVREEKIMNDGQIAKLTKALKMPPHFLKRLQDNYLKLTKVAKRNKTDFKNNPMFGMRKDIKGSVDFVNRMRGHKKD